MKNLYFYLLISILAGFGACKNGLSEKEALFVGNWRMQNYETNEVISPEFQAEYNTNISNLKSRFRLILLEDKTFLRDGFAATTETGEWFINNEGTLLNLKSENQAGTLFIEQIDNTTMVFSIEEGETRVKITLTKMQN
jgi:hypothetical protein